MNWKSVVDGTSNQFPVKDPESGCPIFTLDEGIKVIVVETLRGVEPALAELRRSMQVGISFAQSLAFIKL